MSAAVEVRPASPRFWVRINPEARYAIEQELLRCRYLLADSRETGGLLFGWVEGEAIEVTSATGPGPNFEPQVNEVDLNYDTVLGDDEARIVGDLVIGSWHAHPKRGLLRGADPTQEDLDHWGRVLSLSRYEAIAGIIAIPDLRVGWRAPHLHGWGVWSDNSGTRCEAQGELYP
jgi:hypothetical protein